MYQRFYSPQWLSGQRRKPLWLTSTHTHTPTSNTHTEVFASFCQHIYKWSQTQYKWGESLQMTTSQSSTRSLSCNPVCSVRDSYACRLVRACVRLNMRAFTTLLSPSEVPTASSMVPSLGSRKSHSTAVSFYRLGGNHYSSAAGN